MTDKLPGRPRIRTADIQAIKRINATSNILQDYRPVIAYVMKHSGCTYDEISEVFDVSKQRAEQIVKQVTAKL